MAFSKTALFTDQTGVVTPGDGSNTVTVSSWDSPVVIGAEFTDSRDILRISHLMTDGETWTTLKTDLEDGTDGVITLYASRSQVILRSPGTYALSGSVSGLTTGYSVAVDSSGEAATFGDIENGDYVEIEADGTIILHGEATVWEDLNFSVENSGGPTATHPDDVTINGVFHKEFTSANNQNCGSSAEIYHKAKLDITLYPHLHLFLKSGESIGTTGVTFTINWELRQSIGTTSGSVDLSATSAELDTTSGANKLNIYDPIGFAGPTELGAQLALKLERSAGDAGDVIVTTYGIHCEIDSVGSREPTVK